MKELDETLGQIDFIFEAAGVPQLGFDLIYSLGINGIYVMTGILGEGKPACIPGSETMSQMVVLKNQVIVGSINASRQHFEMEIRDLESAKTDGAIESMNLLPPVYSFFKFGGPTLGGSK
ncbi:hypothetical protein [Arcticibacter tournemirensis]|uniref:hypothetical protein n=1 Tax=Arcticibacter tournemirensis TaxID=699437 RepID=UPI0021D3CFC2|nr:hypothetical protein [Arcticibacter tournemirensis]